MYTQEVLEKLIVDKPEKAIPIIYDQFSGALYGVILRIIKDENSAQDILQEVFVKIWRKKALYDSEKGRLFTWMMQIARNESINFLNSKSEKDKEKIHPLDPSVYNIRSKIKVNIDALDMEDILGHLDKKYREVIELAYFEGYTQKEIAERLDMPLGSVKSCVKIGIRNLRSLYLGKATAVTGFLMSIWILLEFILHL